MFPNVIIAADIRQAEYVADWITRYPSGPQWDNGPGAAPATPVIPIGELAWTSASSAERHLVGLRPKRIIIVDYLRWNCGPPGAFARVAQIIQRSRATGTEVVWW